MASLEEIYQKALADEGGREALAKAACDEAALSEFLTQYGCDVTPQEARAFMAKKFAQTGELSNEELAATSGGDCGDDAGIVCPQCGSDDVNLIPGKVYTFTCYACGTQFMNQAVFPVPPFSS